MLVVKSVPKVVGRKSFFATMSVLVMVATTLFGARVAEADSTWYQSYQRASQEQACVAQPGETPWQDSWGTNPGWSPSWEQWANNGNGGWVCSRSITWARDAAVRVYNVGEVGPGGGSIFYVDMSRAAGSQFWEVGSDLGKAEWGCLGADIAGTGTAIGTGATNTSLIKDGCFTLGIAARVASEPAGGFSDWFLPSKDELNQLCKYARNQSTSPIDEAVLCDNSGTLRVGWSDYYWSSSQKELNYAWEQAFYDGLQDNDRVSDRVTYGVRPVRSF